MWLDATAKQNKSGNSGSRERRVEEGTRVSLGFRRAAERRLEKCPGIQLPSEPLKGLSLVEGGPFVSEP